MQIIHTLSPFLFELFPKYRESGGNLEVLKEEVTDYYTYSAYRPTVSVKDNLIVVDIDVPSILNQKADYDKVVTYCEKGKYGQAKAILSELLKKNPTNTEYYRIMGQILSDEGDQEEAINYLIDSLRWNPKNSFALLMMGNIFAKFKNDIDTAMKYYDQCLVINPNDHIAINNIGANLLQLGKVNEGIKYLEKAYAINSGYPNTLYGLALAYQKKEFPLVAFQYAVQCMKSLKDSMTGMFQSVYAVAIELAEELVQGDRGRSNFDQYKSFLEGKCGIKIKVDKDDSMPTAAKIEFAENYERDFHLIKYKPNYKAVEHLMMHELVHLQFVIEAKAEKNNMLFLSGRDRKTQFIRDNEKTLNKLSREGYSERSIADFISSLYDGINRQIFNTPIDLFIEDLLYEEYPELQPFQFLSLNQLIVEGKAAVTHKQAIKLTPPLILSASRVLNLLNAFQFRDLYGVDVTKQFDATPSEMKEAQKMWTEFLEYRSDKEPGEEYELVKLWGEDLRLDKYYELVDEEDFRKKPKDVLDFIKSVEEDPFGVEDDQNFKKKQTDTFLQSQKEMGTNPAVLWFMVDALQYLNKLSKARVKEIAFEIAMVGTQGINPASDQSYRINSIPGKEFSGYHLLAYYYVSWKIAIPEMLKDLHLPYDNEYEQAELLFKSKETP